MAIDDKTKSDLKTQGDSFKNSELTKEIAEKLKEASASRAPIVRANQKKNAEMAMHIIPVEGENEDLAWDAARWLKQRREAQIAIADKARQEDEALYLYYLKCRNGTHNDDGVDVPPHGIYFVGKPNLGGVKDHEWYSRYKRREAVRRGDNVVCQVCLKMGIPNQTLPYIWTGSGDEMRLVPDPRWVWRTPKNPALYAAVGDSRAFDLAYAASNSWRDEYDRKVAAFQAQEGALTNG